MKRNILIFLFLSLCFLLPYSLSADIPYTVTFEGKNTPLNKEIEEALYSASHLTTLQKKLPSTITSLRRRAEADIPNLKLGLQVFGYYQPDITIEIDETSSPVTIRILVDLGPLYTFSSFELIPFEDNEFPLHSISLQQLGITLGSVALPKKILCAEEKLLQILTCNGYPLAEIEDRIVLANTDQNTIAVKLIINSRSKVVFGDTTFIGLKSVNEQFIRNKIKWRKGSIYDPNKVECTLEAIEKTGLFATVSITSLETSPNRYELPMTIEVCEALHRTIGFGITYNTSKDLGVNFEWENRNIRGFGEKLHLDLDLWHRIQTGALSYIRPDFYGIVGLDLITLGEIDHQRLKSYRKTSFSLSQILNFEANEHIKTSVGAQLKQLLTDNTEKDGTSTLFKLPFEIYWTNTNSLLNPTKGVAIDYHLTPTRQINRPYAAYIIQTLTIKAYMPLKEDALVLAAKVHLEFLNGDNTQKIPVPERIFAGSENTLRGYNYKTVTPIIIIEDPDDPEKKIINFVGGRSMLVCTVELRAHLTESIGAVIFYDLGNVYKKSLPQIKHQQLLSIGGGLRYFTPLGPLRFDVAFPLDRRKNIDDKSQFYLSIGQSF